MRALARVAFVCGLALAATAATVGVAFFGARSWLTWLPLTAGLGAALAGAAGGAWLARVERRTGTGAAGARARLVAECALAVALAVAANAAALAAPLAFDVTASRKNTLTEASVQVARALRAPVEITAVLDGGDRAWAELEALVERYRRETDQLSVRRVAPDAEPTAAMHEARVVVTAGDRQKRIRFAAGAPDQEALLTTALRAVSGDERARVYFLAGHGEPLPGEESPGGLRRFAQALVDEGIEVVALPLAAVGAVPEDAGVVIVAGAERISGAESALLSRSLERGGRLLVLLEPHVDSGLDGLLGAVGIQADDDLVIDGSAFSGLLGGPETATGVAYGSHPVTRTLGGAMTHFSRARSLSTNPGTPAAPEPLVQSGAEAWGEMTRGPPSFDAADVAGPVTLALAAELPAEAGRPAGRIVVVGDASFVTNQGIGLGANQDFALNAMLWLLERDDAIVIRPHGRGGNLLLLSPRARERIAFALLYGLPVMLLCAGLAVSALRRRS
jgi:hypothetical protein